VAGRSHHSAVAQLTVAAPNTITDTTSATIRMFPIARRDYRTEYNRENSRVLAESSRGRHGTR